MTSLCRDVTSGGWCFLVVDLRQWYVVPPGTVPRTRSPRHHRLRLNDGVGLLAAPETLGRNEEADKRVSELLAHAAVNEEVDWITEQDERVDQLLVDVATTGVEQIQIERVVGDQHDDEDSQRELDQ